MNNLTVALPREVPASKFTLANRTETDPDALMSLTGPFHDRRYRHLFCAQVTALVGTGLTTIALALLASEFAGERAGQVLGTAPAIKMIA